MDPFERPYWSTLQAVFWTITRSRGAVRLAAQRRPGSGDDQHLIARVVMPGDRVGRRWYACRHMDWTIEEAEERVRDALSKGHLHAWGRKNGQGERERIPAQEWPDLGFHWSGPRPDTHSQLPPFVGPGCGYVGPRSSQAEVPYWTDVLLEREEMLSLWTEPARNPARDQEAQPKGEAIQASMAKRKGGRSAPWIRPLKRYLNIRIERGHDILSMTLAELRRDFVTYVMTQNIPRVAKARSSLDEQIKKLRVQLVAEADARGRVGPHVDASHDAGSSMDEIVRMTDPSEWKRR